ncbi:MAG: hypothetical protein IT179_15755 [Acidobacteria bacterium]|nr:hypothetical protein [Acidobacteriota bacterium]
MSPILTRPIREQFEHDRVIRQLQARYKRKHDVVINPGHEQNQSVMVGDLAVYPDLVLFSQSGGRKLEGTVEVETGESVHPLEARAEWGVFSRLKVPFHLYVPPQSLDAARRLCEEHQFAVAEIWTYHIAMDQVRFLQVYRAPVAALPKAAPERKPAEKKPAERKPAAPGKPAADRKPAGEKKAAPKSRGTAKPAPRAAKKKAAPARPARASKPAKAKAKASTPASRRAAAKKRR